MVRARVRRGWRRRGALVVAAVASLAWCSSCSSSAGADEPAEQPAVSTPAPAPLPAPATAEAIGLEAPHSGDLPVDSDCPADTEMLDWDGDGWGDCVAAGAPPTISAP